MLMLIRVSTRRRIPLNIKRLNMGPHLDAADALRLNPAVVYLHMKPTLKIWPTKKQWTTWSLPSKLTAIGTLIGVVSLCLYSADKVFSISQKLLTKTNTPLQTHDLEDTENHMPTFSTPIGSTEISDLLDMFLGKPGYWEPWETGAHPGTPISWATEGKYDDPPEYLGLDFGGFSRLGAIILTEDKNPIYHSLKNIVSPGIWYIWLVGPNAGISLVKLESESPSKDLPYDINHMLDSAGFTFSVYKGVNIRSTTANFLIYHIQDETKQSAWLAESWSSGTGGGSQELWITYNKEDADHLWESFGEWGRQHVEYKKLREPSEFSTK